MDRKEAIEYWEEFLEEIPEIEGMPQEEKDKQEQATLMAIAALQEPEQPQFGGWIPVSERLPDECVEVLITATSPDGYIYITTTWYQEKRWVMRHRADKVIAWQPLPEPYKESEEK